MSATIQPKTLKELFALRKTPFSNKRIERISAAYYFSKKAHEGQKRRSGEDYFVHCVETAATLIKMGLGSVTVAAALLHDVPEDTEITLEEVEQTFGKEVAFLVEGVTKLGHVRLKGSSEEYYLDNLRKMFMAMASDIRVILIKLADRLHNMRTLDALPENKRFRIAKETMEIFVPIANRFGIGELKGELEDLSFKYIEPEKYKFTVELETEAYKSREQYIESAIKVLKKELKETGIKLVSIHGRAKRYHSLYKKLGKYDMDIDKVYDLVAIRIVVTTVASCYETLGIVHKKYRPLIGRIKDYISLPKPNGYKSIHTTVFGPEGKILEIQIRTERMHDEAEFGIAAHWIYTQGRTWTDIVLRREPKSGEVPKKELEWVQQLKQWHTETGGESDEFWRSIKFDFFKNHIFAFTPSGDVIELPEGATPIDFAYRIHSEIGDRAMGAKANGKMIALDYPIHNGDLLEIVTSKEKKLPSRDWLKFVKTAHAQAKIKNTLRKGGVHIVKQK